MKDQLRQHLTAIQQAMTQHQLWESIPPSADDLANDQPFGVGTLTPTQWLQWVFIPRMNALIDAEAPLPTNFAITPYLEEALKESDYLSALHAPILALEQLLKTA